MDRRSGERSRRGFRARRESVFIAEADALFGNANDRAANQMLAYLLQRIEDYRGLVILATNLRSQIEDALGEKLQAAVQFPELPEES